MAEEILFVRTLDLDLAPLFAGTEKIVSRWIVIEPVGEFSSMHVTQVAAEWITPNPPAPVRVHCAWEVGGFQSCITDAVGEWVGPPEAGFSVATLEVAAADASHTTTTAANPSPARQRVAVCVHKSNSTARLLVHASRMDAAKASGPAKLRVTVLGYGLILNH
jgi:hypothetical protein